MRDKWYESADTLKQKVRHLRNHRRLGPSYTKCGKRLGESVEDETLAPCQVCEAELLKDGLSQGPTLASDIRKMLNGVKTLRDEFAMSVISHLAEMDVSPEPAARKAYEYADAMMAERERA
jgi:hypothetical protein